MDTMPPDLWTVAKGFAGPVIAAGAGLLIRWADDTRKGDRLTWRRVAFEVPSVAGLGIIGGAGATLLGAPAEVSWGLAALLGHLGTAGVVRLLLLVRRGES